MRAALALSLLLTASPVCAAQFAMVDGLDGRPAVRISGDFEKDDNVKFAAFVKGHEMINSMIISGEGGALLPALKIGQFAHALNMQIVAAADEECASACAFLWLAGARRTVEPGAKIGFHGVFTKDGDQPKPSSDGNAVLGAYLGRLGMTDDQIIYLTRKPPRDMVWLSQSDAQALGITYDVERPKPLPKPSAPISNSE